MIAFKFTATCGGQSLPLEVKLDYKPGNQTQNARRVAVGQLLAVLEMDDATVRVEGYDFVTVTAGEDTWIIE